MGKNVKANETAWHNYGDDNFLMEGGMLIKKAYDPQDGEFLQTYFDVFFLSPLDNAKGGSEGLVYAALAQIDAAH